VYEREFYNKLVNDGGRPLCSVGLIDTVAKDWGLNKGGIKDKIIKDRSPYIDMVRPVSGLAKMINPVDTGVLQSRQRIRVWLLDVLDEKSRIAEAIDILLKSALKGIK
jgi:hypothetical protein